MYYVYELYDLNISDKYFGTQKQIPTRNVYNYFYIVFKGLKWIMLINLLFDNTEVTDSYQKILFKLNNLCLVLLYSILISNFVIDQ